MTNTNLNEDHFSADQVAQIKACNDESVQSFYKKYLQAEAVGDQAAADRYAGIITKRCNLLGVFSSEPVAESDTPAAANEYQRWEDRMKAAGAVVFKSDDPENPTVIRANKIVGGKHVELGEFDLVNDKEMFESSKLMKKYTVEGQEIDLEMWTEQVLAEGATEIRNFKGGKVAYIGESRIGICRVKQAPKVVKKFNDILNESFNVSLNADSNGNKTITVTASEGDAEQLASILKLSGLGHHPAAQPCGCDEFEGEVTEEYANAPDEKYASTDTQLNAMSGGLNKQKRMSNPNNLADNPLAMRKLGAQGSKQLNIEEAKIAESLEAEFSKFNEDIKQDIRNARAKVAKLKTQKGHNSPFGDVTKDLSNAKKELEKLLKQKKSGINFGETALSQYAGDVVLEDVEAEGNIGDEVTVTGNVQFNGATGVIVDFGQDRRFVVVDLYDHGRKSFHSSDVSLSDGESYDDDEADDELNWARERE